jgi:hypothetical protein
MRTLLLATSLVLMTGFRLSQSASQPDLNTRAVREAFLLNARIVSDPAWRIMLDDGATKHLATFRFVADPDTPPTYRLNVAAYELDKVLALNYVAPSVARTVNGEPAVLTWWVDDLAMDELSRRKSKTEPPDLDRWNRQWLVMRAFDELVANVYRDVSPDKDLSTVWDNLLITKDWTIWLIDHTRTFQTRRTLDHPETLTRCERSLLQRLRSLNPSLLNARLGTYLTQEQLEALESRRQLLVKHYDAQIASRGESAVLYDLLPRL